MVITAIGPSISAALTIGEVERRSVKKMTTQSTVGIPLVEFPSLDNHGQMLKASSIPSEPTGIKKSESVSSASSSLAGSLSSVEGADSIFDDADDKLNPRFKTEMCRNFKEKSKCLYGDQCQFAHGRRELREVVRNTKYKTKHCQKYWVTGYCAYGPRCNFLHNEPVLRDDYQSGNSVRAKFPCVKKVTVATTCHSPLPFNPCVGSEGETNVGIDVSINEPEQEKFSDIFASMDRWTDSVYESLVANESNPNIN